MQVVNWELGGFYLLYLGWVTFSGPVDCTNGSWNAIMKLKFSLVYCDFFLNMSLQHKME